MSWFALSVWLGLVSYRFRKSDYNEYMDGSINLNVFLDTYRTNLERAARENCPSGQNCRLRGVTVSGLLVTSDGNKTVEAVEGLRCTDCAYNGKALPLIGHIASLATFEELGLEDEIDYERLD